MSKRPLMLYLIPLFLLSIALSFPIQAALLYDHQLSELGAILSKITFVNWFTMIVICATAYSLYQGSAYCKLLIPLSIGTVILNNYFVGQWGQDFNMAESSMASVLFAFSFAPLMHKPTLTVLTDPKKRWWARAQRHMTQVPITINPFVGQTLNARTFDISDSGVFVSLSSDDLSNIPKVGDKLRLSITLGSMKKLKCDARVVRFAKPTGIYPQGLGLEFIQIDKQDKVDLKRYLSAPQAQI